MENNLLKRLHTYASMQDENFTTESFVHLLEYLRQREYHRFTTNLINGDARVYLSPGEQKWPIGARPVRFQSESDHSRANERENIHCSYDPEET